MKNSKKDLASCEWAVRVRIKTEESVVYGGGVSRLLQLTDELGSLLAAAKSMGMSYRKALEIVKRAEEYLGRPLLKKAIGGVGGGGSSLTPFARFFVYQFRQLEEEVLAFTKQKSEEYFSKEAMLALDESL